MMLYQYRTLVAVTIAIAMITDGFSQEDKYPRLQFQRWSGSINVPDPVALSVDNQGRVFVTQTRRRKVQDLDIRQHSQWIENDVGLTSVAEKRNFLRSQLSINGDQESNRRHVGDHNGDGSHDWRDLTVISERIFRLVDNDQDGTADEITTFAEGFQTEVTGIAAGVLAHEGSVWTTIAPDLWRLIDTDDDGVADERKVLATGFGLHIAYAGHDMHGPIVGPDGRVYWSIGDKGINVTTPDGKEFAYPNQGGVMRCELDGSNFEVFAHGLRNVQEVAFDQYGNFFGVDNDADQPGERERFVWIVDGMDAGWRCSYQYRGDQYNPWTQEKLWELPGDDHPAYLLPPLAHYIDGPAGFKYNPGTALSPEYREFFFLTGAPNGHQYAFRAVEKGDAFEMRDQHKIGSGTAIVGLAFGPDGALYGADWDGGYPLDQKGSVVRIDVLDGQLAPQRREVRSLLAKGFSNTDLESLANMLGHDDQRIRLAAQFELVKRTRYQELSEVARNREALRLARVHAIWGLGQLARRGLPEPARLLESYQDDPDPIIRIQFARTYGEAPSASPQYFERLLLDPHLHVRVAAGLAVARNRWPELVDPLLNAASSIERDQHYLRHSLAMALASCASPQQLANQRASSSEMRRMCALLALRHQKSPQAEVYLDDSSQWIATEAARAIHDDQSILAGLPKLAEAIADPSSKSDAFLRRAINANLRLGHAEHLEALLEFAANKGQNERMRLEALETIAAWNKPPRLDRVDGRYRVLNATDREFDGKQITKRLASLALRSESTIQTASVAAARRLNLKLPPDSLAQLVRSESTPTDLRVESLATLAKQNYEKIDLLLSTIASAKQDALVIAAIPLIAEHHIPNASTILEDLLVHRSVAVQQHAIRGLASLGSKQSDNTLVQLGEDLATKKLDSKIALEVLEALRDRKKQSNSIGLLIEQIEDAHQLGQTPTGKFTFSVDGGDPTNGDRIFRTHVQAQCARCHKVGKKGSDIGPELSKIAKQRDKRHLWRSIVHPSADIEPKYLVQSILLASGQVVQGVILKKSAEKTVLMTGEGKKLEIDSLDIDAISDQKTSLMPDMSDILSPRQVRDLVAYLQSLK